MDDADKQDKLVLEEMLDEAIKNNWEKPRLDYIRAFEACIEIYERRGNDGALYRITAYEMRKKIA